MKVAGEGSRVYLAVHLINFETEKETKKRRKGCAKLSVADVPNRVALTSACLCVFSKGV